MELHEKIVNNHLKEIDVDVRELNFLNSRGIREFVFWIMSNEKLSINQKYNINIIYTKKKAWQKMSFTTLALLSPKLVKQFVAS